ncbi:MAG: outer membrane protein assembly factor BamB family protein, partial [Planctomycetota bacterium]
KRSVRLEKGPAYNKITDTTPAADDDWPAYRCDGSRSGITKAEIPARLSVRWETKLPTKPSAITTAAGKVFACDIHTHTVYALDNKNGEIEWTYTANGRVDSPPTCYRGMVLFGSRDGWVYCLRASDGALAWRFKDLPDKLIGAFGQLESAWPVSGSVLILNDTLYFAAGRSSYLDGGIFVYALNPWTGKLLKSRSVYGPFTEEDGFPVGGDAGFKNDILVTDGTRLYLRQKAFDLDLADATAGKHIISTGGFLDGQPQHRTCWSLTSSIARRNAGDILVSNGTEYYEVQGFPLFANHSYFDPRVNGYTLFAGTIVPTPTTTPEDRVRTRRGKKRRPEVAGVSQELWRQHIPITGKAMAMAGNVLFVAGEPMKFDDPSYKNYVAAYNGELGGRLLAVSATDGKKLAEYKLNAAPVWDSIAIANRQLYIGLADGTVQCLGQ